MGKIIVVTGGARSGKSDFAEQLAAEQAQEQGGPVRGEVLYIATALAFDDEMKDRIKKHRQRRPPEWNTLEKYKDFDMIAEEPDFVCAKTVMFECMGVMLNNLFFDDRSFDPQNAEPEAFAAVEERMTAELAALIRRAQSKSLILVTNEVGMGIVPESRLTRYYRDILGRANRFAAQRADEVYFVVSGIPMKIKQGGSACAAFL